MDSNNLKVYSITGVLAVGGIYLFSITSWGTLLGLTLFFVLFVVITVLALALSISISTLSEANKKIADYERQMLDYKMEQLSTNRIVKDNLVRACLDSASTSTSDVSFVDGGIFENHETKITTDNFNHDSVTLGRNIYQKLYSHNWSTDHLLIYRCKEVLLPLQYFYQ